MIGVFDSGIGGLSVLKALRAELPHEDFVYFADTAHAPYGERGDAYVVDRTRAVVERLRAAHAVKALVIACNTATAAAVHVVRAEHADLPVVGVEPALKPAVAASRTGRIGVLATRGTLGSAKFRQLHASLAGQATFSLQPCDGLADAIEAQDADRIARQCAQYAQAVGPFGTQEGQTDVLVLGCTHYPFATRELASVCGPQVKLIDTGQPVARQTRRLLGEAGLLRTAGAAMLSLDATGSLPALRAAVDRWL
ncbi:glutamate racemase [Caenimonas aquaedulcis]|uniref:Glutamate racemase n=1 Tax=Caenimonas aquaedulcis TaxID=2793270 RepID=A0A931H2N3_9BURK|nr:glutamate racemase [Caenimonas aquaedulcis]MBG9387456.1 glutamate racemase [Caenimonas aquaedulcis]